MTHITTNSHLRLKFMLRFNLSHPQKLLRHHLLLLHALILQTGRINGVVNVVTMKTGTNQDVLALTEMQKTKGQQQSTVVTVEGALTL